MKRLLVIAALVIAVAASAGSIKVWGAETLKYSDLNSNFAHIHNNMVGGHGARLLDADVSSSAAIAHSKLATPALVPKAWGLVGVPGGTACDGAAAAGTACSVGDSSGVTAVATNGTAGQYRVNLSYSPANVSFLVVLTAHVAFASCHTTGAFTATSGDANGTNFLVVCTKTSDDTALNAPFSFIVMDT